MNPTNEVIINLEHSKHSTVKQNQNRKSLGCTCPFSLENHHKKVDPVIEEM